MHQDTPLFQSFVDKAMCLIKISVYVLIFRISELQHHVGYIIFVSYLQSSSCSHHTLDAILVEIPFI